MSLYELQDHEDLYVPSTMSKVYRLHTYPINLSNMGDRIRTNPYAALSNNALINGA